MGCIYKATNIKNNKAYIGFSDNIIDRKTIHYCDAFTRNSPFVFHKALRKYGWENFVWTVLEEGFDNENLLHVREPYYIQKHNTHYLSGWGYNMTLGGDGALGYKFSEEQKKKLSESHLGQKLSKETRKKMSDAHTGKQNTAQHNANIAKAFSKKWLITTPNGESTVIQNLKKFCRDNGLCYTSMVHVADGKSKKHRDGYRVLRCDKL